MGLMKNIAASRDWKGFEFTIRQQDVTMLQTKLNQLNKDVQDKALLKALKAGGKVFIIEAKSRQRVSDRIDAGIRGRSIKTKGGIRGYLAGASSGLPNPAWMEFGTLDKYIGQSKKHKSSYTVKRTKQFTDTAGDWWRIKAGTVIKGGIRPRPFLIPAFNAKYQAMTDKMADILGKEILKHVK